MTIRTFLLLAACLLVLAAVVLTLALVGTPEVSGWLATTARAALDSSAVGFLLVGAAILFLGSLSARAWAVAEDLGRTERARAELAARGYTVLPADVDTSSLMDDSQRGPLPETWRAPCGEVARGWHRCATCGRRVVRESCGEPWARGRVAIGYHLGCGHGRACHAAPSSISVSHQTDSGLPAA